MVLGGALVSMLVIPGESGHELLRVLGFDIEEETFGRARTECCRLATVVANDHVAADHLVLEAVGSACHWTILSHY